jgi:hypothetical protein
MILIYYLSNDRAKGKFVFRGREGVILTLSKTKENSVCKVRPYKKMELGSSLFNNGIII